MTAPRLPGGVTFGPGSVRGLGPLTRRLGAGSVLVLTDPGVAAVGIGEVVLRALEESAVAPSVVDDLAAEPTCVQVERCREELLRHRPDVVVAVGGGGILDQAKAGAAAARLGGAIGDLFGLGHADAFDGTPPVVAVPTTPCTGAELSSHAVVLEGECGRRHAVSGRRLAARAAVVDPDLALTAPRSIAVAGGLDGLLHAVEAYLARGATDDSDAWVEQAAAPLRRGLRGLAPGVPFERSAVADLSLGCLRAGAAMAVANAGLVHALGYPLSARFGIPHGVANGLVAPAVLRASRPYHAERDRTLAALFGADSLAQLVEEVLEELGLGTERLAAHGVRADDVDGLAGAAMDYGPVRANWRFAATLDEIVEIYRSTL